MAKLRTRLAVFLALTLTLVAIPAAGARTTPARAFKAADQLEAQVLAGLNTIRRQNGLAPLRRSPSLSSAAEAHTRSMATFGFFAHDSRDGTEFWQRVRRFYGPAGYATWSVGENLLWSSGRLAGDRALALWMASPGHRKNILTPRWREIGLSALTVSSAPGVFGGRDVVIVTTDFGVRS